MKTPIILSESDRIDRPGDVDVFNSVSALESYLEPWYVNEPHFIFDREGMQLEITATEHCVRLAPKEPRAFKPEVARAYFAYVLRTVASAKGWDYVGVDKEFVEAASLYELAQASSRFANDVPKERGSFRRLVDRLLSKGGKGAE